MAAQDDQSSGYLKSTLGKYSPWTRSPIVPPSKGKDGEPEPSPLQQQHGQDHKINARHRLSLRQYPRDCPPLKVQWFHAVDAPKRRPNPAGEKKEVKPLPAPKKYAAFSKTDSKAIEVAFQKLAEQEDATERNKFEQEDDISDQKQRSDDKPNTSLKDKKEVVKVPVNEDYLFDVDVERRELGPAYWLGPVYDVRRGTWFYQEGSVQRPCDENLAAQLEEGWLKLKAWRLPTVKTQHKEQVRSASQPRARPTSWAGASGDERLAPAKPLAAKGSNPNLRVSQEDHERDARPEAAQETGHQNTYRLFGAHMNSVVTYQDGITAWLLTDDFMSRMNYSMYQRFAGGGHFAGIKITRGYLDTTRKPDVRDNKTDDATSQPAKVGDKVADKVEQAEIEEEPKPDTAYEARRQTLERQMSSLLEDPSSSDPAKQDEELRRRDEKEIEGDYRETDGDEQGREIEHLILVTHGIGQRLGLRIESVNFVHDVNTFRKTIKAVYADSPDLRALNAELDTAATTNSRIQVLPICWRHLLDFPKQSLKHNRKEHDLADSGFGEEEDYPSLDDIAVEGVPAVRNLITDLALDILLYQSPAYKDHISRVVLEECNRIYHLFMQRNPSFNGKISLIGHSLGSAIMFDILCRQDRKSHGPQRRKDHYPTQLDFEVEDFYALGSPIGLFQMLKGRTIAARENASRPRVASTSMDDPMLDAAPLSSNRKVSAALTMKAAPGTEITTSSPKCSQIFNIFHPTDPISYRIEPLISPAMSSLKPQPLPYTKRGIFGAPVGQGLTGIGARVGQSVSSLWSSMSTGIASSLLTRGLGYTGEEPGKLSNGQTAGKSNAPLSTAAGTNVQGGVVPPTAPLPVKGTEIATTNQKLDKVASDAVVAESMGRHPPTLIDQEIETLYGGYQKRRKSAQADSIRDLGGGAKGSDLPDEDLLEAKERGERLRREEEKVRRLNSNGRVDYAIQEGAFDINLLAAIASHLSYWGDEDVSHFMISQLLSRHRVVRPRAASGAKAP